MSEGIVCPCCYTPGVGSICLNCGHIINTSKPCIDYTNKIGRNALPQKYVEQKLNERLSSLIPRLCPGMRVLEVGCAEGELGAGLKNQIPITYWGIEPSLDAIIAKEKLDAVYSDSRALPDNTQVFDAILSFHVLEHLSFPEDELARWHALLDIDGWLMLEVPCRSGHPDVEADRNVEHLHHFSPASLICLLENSQFDLIELTRGHFESPVYTDSLRVLAKPKTSDMRQRQRLLDRFLLRINGDFAVYGLGGDFCSYVEPLIDQLSVKALIDSDQQRTGQPLHGLKVEKYSSTKHHDLHILVCSILHEESIVADLQKAGHPLERIILLSDIYNS